MPNDDLAEIAGKVDKIVRDMQGEREQNRANFPEAARMMDALKVFNPRLIWAEENGKTLGTTNRGTK